MLVRNEKYPISLLGGAFLWLLYTLMAMPGKPPGQVVARGRRIIENGWR